MRTAAILAVATLALSAMLWAADDAVVTPQEAASYQAGGITIPPVLSYQGRLTDATGVPLPDGEYSITFKLYTQPSGCNPFWMETQKVSTRDGLFSVLLGSVTPIRIGARGQGLGTRDEGLGAAYLGMAVEGSEEMTPRLRIAGTGLSGQTDASRVPPGGTDNDDEWVRSSPADSVLYTIRRLGIARGGCSNVLYGDWKCSMTNLGSSCTTGISGAPGLPLGNMAVLGGYGNRVWAPYTSVGGGRNNKAGNEATDTSAIVVGGYGNKANAKFSYIAGGQNNTADGVSASIGGGSSNSASGSYAAIGGGMYNVASNDDVTIAGGYDNVASGTASTIAGGWVDSASGSYATVGGGYYNSASGADATVGGGASNAATQTSATVGGGSDNRATNQYATIGGGEYNLASGTGSTVGGGYRDTASGYGSTVGGGQSNIANSNYATIAGGYYNLASGYGSSVGGGVGDTASGSYARVGGGCYNTASGNYATVNGDYNYATAEDATVSGGYDNTATALGATVAGGWHCDVAAVRGFATNNGSIVSSGHDNSAAFNGQTTTASGQTRVGALSKASGTFTIDHPLDPSGKILNHYFIEGPDMLNIYRGSVVLDASGRAAVSLPDYFAALNRNPHVQLTGVGTYEVYVAEDVSGNRFVVGGKPGAKVYWQVTGDRKDPSAEITRIIMPVEQPKTGALAGHSLDDDFLRSTKDQLDRMGAGSRFDFRTAEGRQKYEEMQHPTKKPEVVR